MAISIADLRQKIDSKHERALKALAEIQVYIDEDQSESQEHEASQPASNGVQHRKRKRKNGSYREQVLAVTNLDWATVDRICQETGLHYKQVRGVLHAPGLKQSVEKREVNGRYEYKTNVH